MRTTRIVASLVAVFLFSAFVGIHSVRAQDVRVEVGGGWAIPSSTVDMVGSFEQDGEVVQEGIVRVDPGAGLHAYASVGLVWSVSSNFALGGRLRAQQSWLRGDAGDLLRNCEGCSASNEPDGRLRAATLEGRIFLVSVGRINPYFLVGLGVVRTTIDGAEVIVPGDDSSEDAVIRISDVRVTDAGGDVGFGALTKVAGSLSLHAEIRATGSLPGAKENAITTFPFSLGLSYGF